MRQFGQCLCLLIALTGSSLGEDILQLGLKSAVSTFTPVPVEKSRRALSAASEELGQYVKRNGENHLCQGTANLSGEWIELNGLKLSRVTYGVVSEADRANGIQERFNVTVECGMHRRRKPGASSWTPWVNGRPLFLPGAIPIEVTTSGRWTVPESSLKYFNPIGATKLAAASTAGGLPPGVSRPVAQQPTNPSASPSKARQNVALPPASITAHSLPTQTPGQTTQAPIRSSPVIVDPPRTSEPKPGNMTEVSSPEQSDSVMPVLVVSVVLMAVLSLVLRKATRQNKSAPVGRHAPPPLRVQSPAPTPPALPSSSPVPTDGSLDLIQRCDNLMTPAELAFFAVLEPLVRSSYMISAKVRLADLFNVGQGAGQQTAFNKISQKHIDFVLTDYTTSRILCGIELDDSSHQRPDRVERDDFVNEVFARNQLPLLRVPVAWTYYPHALRDELFKAGLTLGTP